MSTLEELQTGCGRTLGHGEACVKDYLCESCDALIATYMLHSNLKTVVFAIRSQKRLWKRTTHPRSLKLQNALDAVCSFIEDEV